MSVQAVETSSESTPQVSAVSQPTAENASRCAAILRRRQAIGLSRGNLAILAELTPAKVWRVEDGRPKDAELDVLERALERVEVGGLPEEMRRKPAGGRKSEAQRRLDTVLDLVKQALEAKARRDVDDLLKKALEAA